MAWPFHPAAPEPDPPIVEITLGDEAEAFVHGLLGALWGRVGVPMAPWLGLNQLAHGSDDDLVALAASPLPTADPAGTASWEVTLRRLARDLLSCAPDDAALRHVQRQLLWPLEDELIGAQGRLALTPTELFRLATGALRFLGPASGGTASGGADDEAHRS